MEPEKNVFRRIALGVAGVAAAVGLLLLLGFRHQPAGPKPIASRLISETPLKPLAGVTVVLDPGHGGVDSGTRSGPVTEAALTYRTAVELAACLHSEGAAIVYTVHSRRLDPILAATEPPLEYPADAVMAATGKPLEERHSAQPLWQRAGIARAVWRKQCRFDPKAARDVFFLSLHYDHFAATGVHGGLVCIDRRTRHVPPMAQALAGQMMLGNLGRREDYHGISDLSGRQLGVLDPLYNPIPEKALLEIATLSNPENAVEAGDASWRGEVVRRVALAITLAHQKTLP